VGLIEQYENTFFEFIQGEIAKDLAHDVNHVLRVVKTAKLLCLQENAVEEIVVPAAYLHDCFSFEKNHPQRSQSSKFAADKALLFLKSINYPDEYFDKIHHAILAHSFSAKIETSTLEAEIVQDADRLDALGAIGIARCFLTGAKLDRPLYSDVDAFCSARLPDDSAYTIDHFYAKLLKLADTMKTKSAHAEAQNRTHFMREYLKQLEAEV
jgi:uncharacterized protein